MKKVSMIAVIALTAIFMAGLAFGASIVGSSHDMRTFLTDEVTTQVCVFCHTPHNASTTVTAPLWNHTDTSTVTFNMYTSATIQGSSTQPAGVSRACLSCHDGTVAVNSLLVAPADGTVGTLTAIPNTSNAYLGIDLTNDHPVSITYVPGAGAGQDPGLTTNTGATVVGATWTAQLFGSAAPYTVECASCHNVHDPLNTPFLRIANTNSQMCTTCHIK